MLSMMLTQPISTPLQNGIRFLPHLCILTLLSSLAPLHLMLADTPWPHGFGATLANVGPLSEGFERSVASPLQPRRLRAMGRTVRSISSLSDNHSNSFQVAIRI